MMHVLKLLVTGKSIITYRLVIMSVTPQIFTRTNRERGKGDGVKRGEGGRGSS